MTATIVRESIKSLFCQEFAKDVELGLSAKPKHLTPKYFYDKRGSELFEEICRQPEYYPTRTETSILERYSSVISGVQDNSSHKNVIIELGSGSSSKTKILLQSFLQTKEESIYYFPIDISHSILQNTVKMLGDEFPSLHVMGLSTDYFDGIEKANEYVSTANVRARRILVFLGSSIGNIEPEEVHPFLKSLTARLNEEDSLLVGFDLQKDEQILNAAYNDAAGITAKFNLNILYRINEELGGEFEPSLFKHNAFYNREKKRIEMHLVSLCKQQVYIREIDKTFGFEKGESIHTENSYKYTTKQIDLLAKGCGLRVKEHFIDSNRWFDLALFERVAA